MKAKISRKSQFLKLKKREEEKSKKKAKNKYIML